MALFTKYKDFIFVLFVALLASWPLFHAGLMPTHDGEYHLIRFYEFDKTLRLGNWYPRWAPDLNFGYGLPLFTYVYPLPNYIASLLHFLGASFLDSVKLDMALATIVGGLLFYLFAKEFWGKRGGVVSVVFYLFAPYRFVDIYVRGSVGEVMALGVFPGFLWAYTKFVKTNNTFFAALSALFLALTIFSHNILGLMFFAFALFYMLLLILQNDNKKKVILFSLSILILSLGLSAIFWIPALFETQLVTGLQVYNIAQNFPDLFQLLFPSWGSGFFGSNLGDQMSVQIGLANFLAITLSIVSFVGFIKRKQKESVVVGFFLVSFILLFLLMLSISLPLWQNLPLIHYFQFPWRLLSLEILVCAFLAGSVVFLRKSNVLASILIIFAVVTTYVYTQPAYYMMRNDTYYVTRPNFIDSTNSPGNVFNTIWNTTKTTRPRELLPITPNVLLQKLTVKNATDFTAVLLANKTTNQSVSHSYFPNWHMTVDGKSSPTFANKDGLLTFSLPKGVHTIHVFFSQTPLEETASWITGISFFFLLIFLLRKSHK